MLRSAVGSTVLALLLAAGSAAPAASLPIGRLAAIGDSLSDEYFETSFGYASSWTQLLVDGRGVDMGPLADGTWGEPRRTGYEDDWARYGASVSDTIAQGQPAGVVSGVEERGVTHVVIFAGAIDFGPLTGNTFWNPVYAGTWNQGQIDAYVAARVASLESILDLVEPTGVRIVLSSVPDASPTPACELLFPDVAGRTRVAAAVGVYTNELRLVAQERGLVFVDGFAFAGLLFGSPAAERPTILVGGVEVDLDAVDPDGFSPENAWVSDSFHPNTIVQAMIANLMVTALDHYGAGVDPFTEEELDSLAGLVYGGSDTLEAELGATFSDFVEDYSTLFVDGFENGLDPWTHVP